MFPFHAVVPILLAFTPEPAHVRTQFHFTVDLSYETAFPLFGASEEQKWFPGWKPQFLHPIPPADREGAVFLVDHGPSHSSMWTMTRFDPATGQVQYVYLLNGAVLTRIDIAVARNGNQKTTVTVVYERTALDPAANEHVRSLANHDARAADEWKALLDAYASKLRSGPARP
jgi:hypothetical protein